MTVQLNSQQNTDRLGVRHPEWSTEAMIHILRSNNYSQITEMSRQFADRMDDQIRQMRALIEQSRQRAIQLDAAKRRCDEACRAMNALTESIKAMTGVMN